MTSRKMTFMPRHNSLPVQPLNWRPAVRLLCASLALLALSMIPGCGAKTGDVTGKVYYKGKVVTSGFVTMVGSDGISRQTEISEDGTYKIANVPTGDAKVAISSPNPDLAKGPGGRPQPKHDTGRASPDAGGSSLSEV